MGLSVDVETMFKDTKNSESREREAYNSFNYWNKNDSFYINLVPELQTTKEEKKEEKQQPKEEEKEEPKTDDVIVPVIEKQEIKQTDATKQDDEEKGNANEQILTV